MLLTSKNFLMIKFLKNLFQRHKDIKKKVEYFSVYPWVPMDESYLRGLNIKKEMPIAISSYQGYWVLYPFNTSDGREWVLFQTNRGEVFPVIFPIILEDEGFKLSYIDKEPVNDIVFYKESSLTGEDKFGIIKFFNQDWKLFARGTRAFYDGEVVHKYPVDEGVVMRQGTNLVKVDIDGEGDLKQEFFEQKVNINPEVIIIFPGEVVANSIEQLWWEAFMIWRIEISKVANLFAMVFKIVKSDREDLVVEIFEDNTSRGVFKILSEVEKIDDQLIQDMAFWREWAKMGVVKFFVGANELKGVIIPPVYEGKEIVGKTCYVSRWWVRYKLSISSDWSIQEIKI